MLEPCLKQLLLPPNTMHLSCRELYKLERDCTQRDNIHFLSSSLAEMFFSWTGSYSFIQQHIRETDPRAILRDLLPETVLPPDLDDMTLWQIIINISEPPKRKKRKDINTLEDVVRLLHESKRILVLTGAGVCIYSNIILLYHLNDNVFG